MSKTPIFWDIDGVLSIVTHENAANREKFGYGLPAWPIPMAYELLRAVDSDRRFSPMWLSSWDTASVLWNDRAHTKHWPVGYCLSSRQARYARQILPAELFTAGKCIDRKLIAIQYHTRHYPIGHPIIWIEDGFADETETWARQRGNVRLIDTTQDPVLSALLADGAHLDKQAQDFVNTYLVEKSSPPDARAG